MLLRMILVRAVREIQSSYVHAGVHQAFDDAWRGAGGADGADNL